MVAFAFPSRSGVVLLIDFAEARHVDVGVDLRRRDAFVTEHFLDLAEVGAVLEHVGRETVSNRVRADIRGRADADRVFLNKLPERFSSQFASAP